jgi:transposase
MGRPSKYPEEFRREAVELYRPSDRPRRQIAESLGISDGSLAARVKEADAADEPGALDVDERAELASLRKKNSELKMDREILRKAAAYFAKETIR